MTEQEHSRCNWRPGPPDTRARRAALASTAPPGPARVDRNPRLGQIAGPSRRHGPGRKTTGSSRTGTAAHRESRLRAFVAVAALPCPGFRPGCFRRATDEALPCGNRRGRSRGAHGDSGLPPAGTRDNSRGPPSEDAGAAPAPGAHAPILHCQRPSASGRPLPWPCRGGPRLVRVRGSCLPKRLPARRWSAECAAW